MGTVMGGTWVGWEVGCMVMVGVVCTANTLMAAGLITWLERMAMVPKVVMGMAREVLVPWPQLWQRWWEWCLLLC